MRDGRGVEVLIPFSHILNFGILERMEIAFLERIDKGTY